MNIIWEKWVVAAMMVCSLLCSSLFCLKLGDDTLMFLGEVRAIADGERYATEASQGADAEKTETKPPDSTDTASVDVVSTPLPDYEKQESAVSSSVSSALPAAADGKKLGNILPQFFSPYTTANQKSGKLYVNNRTGLDIDIAALKKSFSLKLEEGSEPQVLIVHTHATENYASRDTYYTKSDMARTGEESRNVIGVGNQVEKVLRKAGIGVIHDKTLHDSPSYSGSYNRSYNTVEKYLKKYPTIRVVLDIHRDAIGEGDDLIKPVVEIKGKQAAQVMVCVGSNTGSVDYYPDWEKNLSFGLSLQENLETLYPGLARALFLAYDRCWNQNLSTGSIIIEFGTNGNTFAEAKYSASLVGNALVATLR